MDGNHELQEVQEKTIYEEENEQLLSAAGPSRTDKNKDDKSKNLSKKQ